MANEKRIAESKVSYQTLIDDLSEPIIIEREGTPVAVMVAYADYQYLKLVDTEKKREREEAFKDLEALIAEVHAQPSDLTPEEIEAEITEAIKEVRAERNAHRSRS